MLGLSLSQVRAYVRSGLLEPERGPRGELRFSFQDLVLLRAARGLVASRIGPRRIGRALSKLREQLPGRETLAGLQISAEGKRIVVTDGSARWQPESGQTLLDFDGGERAGGQAPAAAIPARNGTGAAEGWYERGCELEGSDTAAAEDAYRRALALEPSHAGALVNLGRLLHEAGDAVSAEEHYRRALAARPDDTTAAFNLGVALEDLGRDAQAIGAYERVVELDPEHADAHFNAAGVCERTGRSAAANRQKKASRLLLRARPQ